MSELKIKLSNYQHDLSKIVKEVQTIKGRLLHHNYTADEVKLAKYKNQTKKCNKDVESLMKRLKSAQENDIPIIKKKLELRKVDCANVEKTMETTQLLLVGRDKLLHHQKDLEHKTVKIEEKIKHYEVRILLLCCMLFKIFCHLGVIESKAGSTVWRDSE